MWRWRAFLNPFIPKVPLSRPPAEREVEECAVYPLALDHDAFEASLDCIVSCLSRSIGRPPTKMNNVPWLDIRPNVQLIQGAWIVLMSGLDDCIFVNLNESHIKGSIAAFTHYRDALRRKH